MASLMEKQELQKTLTELHQELSTAQDVDDSTKAMLVTVMQDITKLLANTENDSSETPTGSDSLRAMVIEFEAEHPKLARTLGQLADGLANLGI